MFGQTRHATPPGNEARVPTEASPEAPLAPLQQIKIEGEIVNDLERLRTALDRGWALDRKVIGNWYLLLWPPQTLIWWSVDYNKEDALRLLLDYAERTTDQEALDRIANCLRDASAWSRRKGNDTMVSLLDSALCRLTSRLTSLSLFSDADTLLDARGRSVSTISVVSTSDGRDADATTLEDRDCHTNFLLDRLQAIKNEEMQIASQMGHVKGESEREIELVAMQLEEAQRKLSEAEEAHVRAGITFETAKEQMEIARAIFEASEEQLRQEKRVLETSTFALDLARRAFDAVSERRAILESLVHRIDEGMKPLPVSVSCTVCLSHEETAAKKRSESYSSLLECPICRDSRIERSFQCGHALCTGCTKQIHELAARRASSPGSYQSCNDRPKCPMCKATIESIHPLYI